MTTKATTPELTVSETLGDADHDFLAMVPLDAISISDTNEMFRDPAELTDESLKELTDSIREKGLLQPILLRGKGNGNFILVAGERRYRACTILGLETIPAYVKNMTEAEALELQLTENLQRKDVHPMKEARAYRHLMEQHGWKTDELALRFGKSETYILQRLKLNTLIPEAAKDFASDLMTLAQAIVIARLQEADQKELVKHASNKTWHTKERYYDTVQELEEYIQENITMELKEAPFDINDAALVPKAGACTTCPKRSGAQSSLFADVKQKDQCFDRECFKVKKGVGILAKVKQLAEEQPDTIFLLDQSEDKPIPQIGSLLASQGIKPLKEFSENNWAFRNPQVSHGFMLNGDKAGKTVKFYTEGKSAATKKAEGSPITAADKKQAVARIKERWKRNIELDDEKVYWQIIEGLQKSKSMKADTAEKELPIDKVLMRWIILQHAGYDKAYIRGYNFRGTPDEQIKAIGKMSDKDFLQVARKIMLKEYSGQSPTVHTAGGRILWQLAEALKEVPVADFVKEQAEVRAKREANAKKRIEELSKKGGKK